MNEAVPNMGVDQVWSDFGFDGTGSVVAVLDTGVRGDHEGLNDMDDEPFTTGCEQPDPDLVQEQFLLIAIRRLWHSMMQY